MEYFPGHALRKINEEEFALVLYLDDSMTEFSGELGSELKARKNLLDTAKQIVKERYNGVRISVVKINMGGSAFSTIPFLG